MIDFVTQFLPALQRNGSCLDYCPYMMMDLEFPYDQLLAFLNDPGSFGVKPEDRMPLIHRAGLCFTFRRSSPGFIFDTAQWSHAGKHGLIDEARCVAKYWFEIALHENAPFHMNVTLSQYMFFNVLEAAFRGHAQFVETIGNEYLVGNWNEDTPQNYIGMPFSWHAVFMASSLGVQRARRFNEATLPFLPIGLYCISKGASPDDFHLLEPEIRSDLAAWFVTKKELISSVDLEKERQQEMERTKALKERLVAGGALFAENE